MCANRCSTPLFSLMLLASLSSTTVTAAFAHPTIWEPGKSSSSSSTSSTSSKYPGSYDSSSKNNRSNTGSRSVYTGDIDQYFVVGEGVGEVKTVSKEFVNEIKTAIRELPSQFHKLVFARGIIIYIYPTVMDRPLSMKAKGEWPKGFPTDCQFWSLPGTCRGNSITVGEYVVRKDRSYKRLNDGRSNVRHEFGHALDTALKRFSSDADFVEAYDRDMRNLTPEQRSHIGYYLPDRHGGSVKDGREEAFAELFAAKYGGCETSTEKKVVAAFPFTVRAMDKRLQEAISGSN